MFLKIRDVYDIITNLKALNWIISKFKIKKSKS